MTVMMVRTSESGDIMSLGLKFYITCKLFYFKFIQTLGRGDAFYITT